MSYASVVPVSVTPTRTEVRWNKRSVVLSGIMFLNVAIMPLKAYISEPLPFVSSSTTASLPLACTERHTTLTSFDLHHVSFSKPQHRLVAVDLPYYVIYTNDQTTFAPAFADNASVHVPLAASARLLNIPIFYGVLWTQLGNDTVDYYIGIHCASASTAWLVTKLVARSVLALYLVRCTWYDYYRHCFALARNLRLHGMMHHTNTDAKGDATGQAKVVYLLVGDPTSQILQHPVVLAAFVLDFWMSPEYVMRAILRVMQVADISSFLVASLYLSRTVWFSFGALRVSSALLKRLRKERLCADVDPTLLAFAAVAVAGPISYGQSQLRALVSVYHYLCTALAHDATSIEMVVAALLYTIVMGCLPLTYGFALGRWRLRRRRPDTAAQIVKYQDVKHKWGLLLCLWPHKGVQRAGGSVHCLFATRPEAKAVVGLSQTGTDCFIVYHTDAKTTHCVRVSLLPSIDLHRLLKEIKTNKDAAVGHVDLGAPTPSVYTGANASPWVM